MKVSLHLRRVPPLPSNRTRYGWEVLVGVGALLCLLGAVALAMPVITSLTLSWLLGALLLASGIVQLIHSFRAVREPGSASRFLLAALSLVAGALTLIRPAAGAMGITLILAFYFMAGGVGRWVLASELRPARGWGVFAFSAFVSLALGAFLVATFPVASLIVPGVFFGVDLLVYGVGCIAVAFEARRGLARRERTPGQKAA